MLLLLRCIDFGIARLVFGRKGFIPKFYSHGSINVAFSFHSTPVSMSLRVSSSSSFSFFGFYFIFFLLYSGHTKEACSIFGGSGTVSILGIYIWSILYIGFEPKIHKTRKTLCGRRNEKQWQNSASAPNFCCGWNEIEKNRR